MVTSGWGLGVTSHSDTVSDREVVGDDVKEVVGVGEGALEEVAGVDTTRKSWAGGAAAEAPVPGASDCAISRSG